MFADFRVWQLAEDSLVLSLEKSLLEPLQSTLAKYLAFSKADISAADSQFVRWALWGDAAGTLLGDSGSEAPTGWEFEGALVSPSLVSGAYELLVPTDCVAQLADVLAETEAADEAAWRFLEITNGVGHVHADTAGLFIPQMLNYQLTGHVSFSKGCYTGQEVVARMHYRGKVKRPMQYCTIPATDGLACPPPGTPLYRPGSEQAVGHVVAAVVNADALHLLVNLALDAADSATLGVAGPTLQQQPLPYTLSEAG